MGGGERGTRNGGDGWGWEGYQMGACEGIASAIVVDDGWGGAGAVLGSDEAMMATYMFGEGAVVESEEGGGASAEIAAECDRGGGGQGGEETASAGQAPSPSDDVRRRGVEGGGRGRGLTLSTPISIGWIGTHYMMNRV